MVHQMANPVVLQAELVRLEGKHGPALRSLLGAIHRVAVEMDKPFDNYLLIQSLAREAGCSNMLPILADLELAGFLSRSKGDIYFPVRRDYGAAGWGPDNTILSVVREFLEQAPQQPPNTPLEVPPDLFSDISGHDEVKELLQAALSAEKPVHILLVGPPALAKSLFLWDIETAAGEQALWLPGSATSRAGLWDMVAERRPRVLLIDELDKMGAADTAALLSLMEGGRLVRAKVGRRLDEEVKVWVMAAANSADRLSAELRSRFALRHIQAYGREEFRRVVSGVLVRREKVGPELAEEIAAHLDGRTQDMRDAIRVARLASQVGVERAIELLLGG